VVNRTVLTAAAAAVPVPIAVSFRAVLTAASCLQERPIAAPVAAAGRLPQRLDGRWAVGVTQLQGGAPGG